MSVLINVSIDLTKIDKSKIVNGKYLNLTISVNDNLDNYGNNVAITVQQSKDERESKAPRTYLGNGRVVYTAGEVKVAEKQENTNNNATVEDLPF